MTCPACGAAVDVPRLRDLSRHAVGEPTVAAPRWNRSQGWLLVTCLVAVVAAVAAVIVPSVVAPPRLLPDESAIRAAVGAVDAATIYKAWQAMQASGIDRGALPEELRFQQAAGSASRIAMLLWVIAAVAAVGAAAAGVCMVSDRSAIGDAASLSKSRGPTA